LRREDEESKQQKNRRPIDVGNDLAGADAAENHQGDGAEQGDAHAIELQARNTPRGDAKVSNGENRQDDRSGMGLDGSDVRQ